MFGCDWLCIPSLKLTVPTCKWMVWNTIVSFLFSEAFAVSFAEGIYESYIQALHYFLFAEQVFLR